MMMRDFWKTFALSTVVGLGLVASALLAQSGSPDFGTSSSFDSSLDTRSSALDSRSSIDARSSIERGSSLDARSTLSGASRIEPRLDRGLFNQNSSLSGSIYGDGRLDPFRDLTNYNSRRLGFNPLGSPYANGNANPYER